MSNRKENKTIDSEGLDKIAPLLFSIPKLDVFSAPPNYFDTLNRNVNTLCLIEKVNCYTTPEGYFDTFSERILELTLISKKENFVVPQGYFDLFPSKVQELLTPTSHSVFNAPEGYFENLPRLIQERIYESNKKSVFNFPTSLKLSLAFVTSCVILFFVINAFWFVDNSNSNKQKLSKVQPPIENANPINKELQATANEVVTNDIAMIDVQILEEQIDINKMDNALVSESNKNSQTDVLSDYLLENGIDESLIKDAI